MKKRHQKNQLPAYSKQWLYFMINFPLVFVVKVGISRDRRTLLNRWTTIDEENIGIDIPIFAIKVFHARVIEVINLQLASKLLMKVNFFNGTGRTERFFILGAIPAFLMAVLWFLVEWCIKIGLAVLFVYTMKNFPEQ